MSTRMYCDRCDKEFVPRYPGFTASVKINTEEDLCPDCRSKLVALYERFLQESIDSCERREKEKKA